MKKILLFPPLLLLFACSEEIDVRSRSDYDDYLSVQAVLTDLADEPQKVVLSRTISYFQEEAQPMVKGALVKVNDIVFTEMDDGVYVAPMGFCCQPLEKYHLQIRLSGGEEYEADTQMPEPGFEMEGIDYAWSGGKTMDNDSLWTIGLWGIEKELESDYMVVHAVNGLYEPFDRAFLIEDTYFNDHDIAAFPIEILIQTEANRKQYGDCYKFLEEGDVITLEIWSLKKDFMDYLYSLVEINKASIPLFSSQPANLPTNIRGEQVLGYFAACSVARASVVVEEPFRPYFKRALPSFPE